MIDRMRQQFGNYRLIRSLGMGGFAEVYLGEHIHLATEVAIKLLRAQLTDEDVEKFRTEARIIARLRHPHIIRVLDFGVEYNTAYLVMDYAPNGTLRQRHPEGIPLQPTTILSYVKQIASALQYAHEQKLIHRDIKPQNLLLGADNEVLLSDFGLAEIVQSTLSQITQEQAGSPSYMAPEQFLGKPRPASDQYSFGIVIYEWICGSRPFKGTLTELYSQHRFAALPPLREKLPTITRAVEAVVMRALAKDPHQRFASVQDFADALEQAYKLEPYFLPAPNFNLPPPLPTESAPGKQPSVAQPEPALTSFDSSGPTAFVPAPPPVVAQAVPSLSESPPNTPPSVNPITSVHDASLAPSQPEALHKRKLSRRTVLVGLIGSAIVVGGGTAAFVLQHASQGPSGALGPHPTPTPTPLPPPLGTTFVTYSQHTDAVKGVAWSPDGKLIASSSLDKTVRVWNASTGKDVLLAPYMGHHQGVKTVAWSPNGKLIASGGLDGTVQVWDALTGSTMYTYTGHAPQVVRSLAWSPDGRHIVSGAEDNTANTANTVQVWDATTGNNVFSYPHRGGVLAVAWSPDGNSVASGSWGAEHTVQVWSITTRSQIFTYTHHTSDVRALAWSPDSTRIASGSYDKTVQIWDAFTGNNLITCPVQSQVETVSWQPKGQRIASGSDDFVVRIWDATNGQLIFPYTQHASIVWTIAWSPDGTRIASGSGGGAPQKIDHTVRVWQAK